MPPLVPVPLRTHVYAIDIAIRELGIKEATDKNDGIPAERYMRGDEYAWCAGLMLYCNEISDDLDITPDDWSYFAQRKVSTMLAHFQKHGAFIAPKHESKRNDFIFFGNTASDVGVQGSHIGIVELVKDGWVHTIEGNTSNMVARRKYKLTDKTIVGYGRVELIPAKAPSVERPVKK